MTAVLKMNIDELDAKFIKNMKKEHAASDIEIRMIEAGGDAGPLSETDFWEIISHLDWTKEDEDDAAVLQPAVVFLAQKPLAFIYAFVDALATKLHALDTKAHAQVFLENDDSILSVDDFLYVRCAVLASGKKAFETVLADPSKMPLEVTFEPLLHLATAAYRLKTGKKAILKPTISYETYANKKGWNI